MLLSDILKNTAQDHVEYNDLKNALDQISKAAMFVNEGKRKHEQSQVLLDLQKQLATRYKKLVQPNRQYIRDAPFKLRNSVRMMIDSAFHAYMFSDVIILKEIANKDDNKKKKKEGPNYFFFFFNFAKLVEKQRRTFCNTF